MASTESDCVEVDEPEIEQVDGRKNDENTWSVTNSRIVIDFYKDNAVLYDKSHKDKGSQSHQGTSPQVIPSENSVLKDEVAAYCNYIRLTLSKFSASNFRRAKKCIGDILFQIEDNGEVDTRITPHIAYSRDRYSPTPSSSHGSVGCCTHSLQYPRGDYYNF